MTPRLAGKAGRNLLLIAALLFFGIPLVWLFLAPSKTNGELAGRAPLSFGSFASYGAAMSHLLEFNHGILFRWILNSVVYSVGGVSLALILTIPAGYALAKFTFRGRSVLLFSTLVFMVVPTAALILPLYLEMSTVGLTNTVWAVILPTSFYPFGVYLIYLYALNTVPDSVLEAARIDGASEFRIMVAIFLPMARPAVVLVMFLCFASAWNSFFLPFIMLTDVNLANLQTGLQILVSSTNALGGANFTGIPIKAPEAALASLISVLPILVLFLFAQKHLVGGQTAAAEKG
jgi:multiple sugar transport system permease protein